MHDRDVIPESQLAAPAATGAASGNGLARRLFGQNRRNAGLLVALGICLLILAIFAPRYMSLENFIVVGLQMSYIGIMAIGTAFLIISGNIDLSIGSLFGFTAVVAAMLSRVMDPQLAILVGILTGGLIGLVNGAMVWRVKISPIIITLGSLTILHGIVLLLTNGYTVRGVPPAFATIGQYRLFSIPTPLYVFILMAILAHIVLHSTTIGRHIFAIGGNREASEASGLPVRKIVLWVFAINGIIVGISGVLAASRFVTAAPTFGIGYELEAITAVILGGVAFTGGEGNITGVILGVALLAVLNSGLVALGVDPHYTEVVKGAALIIAVTLDQLAHERQEKFRTMLAMRERERAA
jgi:ribose/xylose/arabinose/galactoside ABC-type transport system permease subunit